MLDVKQEVKEARSTLRLLLSMGCEPGEGKNQKILFTCSSYGKWQGQVSCDELAAWDFQASEKEAGSGTWNEYAEVALQEF